jgi:pimeloyl-ACP methyl ester carboxylesterase
MQPSDVRVEVSPGVTLRVRVWPGHGADDRASASERGGGDPSNGADDRASAAPYLLVHGLSSNARLWDGVARHLAAAGRAAYAVDQRSHGESDAPADGYDTSTAAADLAVVCRRLDLPPVVAVGQSWGGNVVVRLAAEHPELVTALALVDGGWIDLSTEFASWERCETALRPPDVDGTRPEKLRGYIAMTHPDWSAEVVDATMANLRVAPDGHLERRLAIPNHMSILRSMWDDPPWRDYPRVAAPSLLLPAVSTDAEAAQRRRALVDKAAAALARSRVREYVGADHDLHAQHPQALAADLLSLGAVS